MERLCCGMIIDGRYFICTALLVITNISRTQKWASQWDATLLFGKRTERIKVYVLYDWVGLYFVYAQRCWFVYKFKTHKNGRRDSQNPPLQQRTHTSTKNTLETHCSQGIFFPPNSSLKWMNNAALQEATNRGVLVNTSQVGSF